MNPQDRPILIVEDTGPCATTLEIALAQIEGATVHVVPDAEHARRWLERSESVSVVITDLNLPQSSGFELIEWVRSHAAHRRIPIVVVSGDSNPESRDRSLRRGADAYFTKPFSPSEVRRKVEELIHAG